MLALIATAALVCGCREDMQNQPKFVPQRSTSFFADGRSARPQVTGTVGRGQLESTANSGAEVDALPFPVTMTVLRRGQERYNIYCTPCHSAVGNGAGMIVQRGYEAAGNFHDTKRLGEPLGHYYNVITYGYGSMPDYSAQIAPEDRWAIAAYIRALQLSQNAKQGDMPPGEHLQNLGDIAQQEGYPANFAEAWEIPPTAVKPLVGPGTAGNAMGTSGPNVTASQDIGATHRSVPATEAETNKELSTANQKPGSTGASSTKPANGQPGMTAKSTSKSAAKPGKAGPVQ